MFPNNRAAIHFLPLIAGLAFLAHVHYTKTMRSIKFEHHAFAAPVHGEVSESMNEIPWASPSARASV